jgi:hypothetical protein
MRSLIAAMLAAVRRNVDLISVWLVLIVVAHHVPVTHFFGRADLVPWMTLTLSIAVLLRGRSFGLGPHPALTPRVDWVGEMALRVGAALSPWGLLFAYDAGRTGDPRDVAYMFGAIFLVVVAEALGSGHGQTAWQPVRGAPIFEAVTSFLVLFSVACFSGYGVRRFVDDRIIHGVGRAAVIGVSFMVAGLIYARIENHRQRAAAGRKDGVPYRSAKFGAFLAIFGPTSTLAIVFSMVNGLDFDQSFTVSLIVLVWAGIVWPPVSPIMVSVVLHEVIAKGGADPRPTGGQAQGFDAPPEGALRFNPLYTTRTLVMHPWLVPVRSSRIAELDDPIRPLWEDPPPLLQDHTLGDAAFEPDPLTRQDQWDVITLRLRGRTDMATMQSGDAQTRRMVVLRAFPAPGTSSHARMATYRWEQNVPEQTMQVLDQTTEFAELRDGDILVLSAEGVARAFEIEIGAPVYRVADALQFRAPQLEDYTEAG